MNCRTWNVNVVSTFRQSIVIIYPDRDFHQANALDEN